MLLFVLGILCTHIAFGLNYNTDVELFFYSMFSDIF